MLGLSNLLLQLIERNYQREDKEATNYIKGAYITLRKAIDTILLRVVQKEFSLFCGSSVICKLKAKKVPSIGVETTLLITEEEISDLLQEVIKYCTMSTVLE